MPLPECFSDFTSATREELNLDYLIATSTVIQLRIYFKKYQRFVYQKAPYTMLKESSEELTGNERFEGMCIDLVRELARALGFNYTLRPVADDAPGQFDHSTGRWNGMIGELLEGRADLAIADLTITSEREAVVDFTMQFMNLGEFHMLSKKYLLTALQINGSQHRF